MTYLMVLDESPYYIPTAQCMNCNFQMFKRCYVQQTNAASHPNFKLVLFLKCCITCYIVTHKVYLTNSIKFIGTSLSFIFCNYHCVHDGSSCYWLINTACLVQKICSILYIYQQIIVVNKRWQDMVNQFIIDKNNDCGFVLVFILVILHQNQSKSHCLRFF